MFRWKDAGVNDLAARQTERKEVTSPCHHPFAYGTVISESSGEGELLGRDTHSRDKGLVRWTIARQTCRDCGADLGVRRFDRDDYYTGKDPS